MMLTGRTLSASAARGIGLVDKVVEPACCSMRRANWRSAARSVRSSNACWPGPPTPGLARQLLAPQMAKQVARKARKEHYPAPYALI